MNWGWEKGESWGRLIELKKREVGGPNIGWGDGQNYVKSEEEVGGRSIGNWEGERGVVQSSGSSSFTLLTSPPYTFFFSSAAHSLIPIPSISETKLHTKSCTFLLIISPQTLQFITFGTPLIELKNNSIKVTILKWVRFCVFLMV